MELRPLGRTGVSVSQFCLGAMMFGAWATPTTTSPSASSTRRSTRASTSSTPPTSTGRASPRRSRVAQSPNPVARRAVSASESRAHCG